MALFDPLTYTEGKTVQVSYSTSNDGTALLLGITEKGREISDFRVLDVATGKLLPDLLPHSMFAHFVDGKRDKILYFQLKNYDVHDPLSALNPRTRLHTLGTPVHTDKTILSDNKYPQILDSVGWVSVKTFENSPYMFAEKSTASNYKQLYYAPKTELEADYINWKKFNETEDEIWNFWPDGKDIYYLTTKGNEYFSIRKVSFPYIDFSRAQDIFKGTEEWKVSIYGEIAEIYKARDYLVINLSKHDVISKNITYNLKTGKTDELNFPLEGNVTVIPFSAFDNECRAINYGWTMPNTYYNYDIGTAQFSKGSFYVEPHYPDLGNMSYEEIEVPSHDGVLVPLSIIYDKTKMKKDGSNTTLMIGYGAYGTSFSAGFNSSYLPMLSRGVVFAIAHVRGGGEKGNNWHKAGLKANKPNTWKDFNACADYLIQNKYTSASKLGCEGASAGGILIGRAITERPDLYKVAIAKVGVLNPLRLVTLPNSQGNFPEYGTVTDSLEFKALVEMDALYHVKKGVKYPAQLITTGFNDPRVQSYFPGKFAGVMQDANDPKVPILLSVDFNAGHFGGSNKSDFIKQLAKEYAFLLWQTGHHEFKSD